MQVCAIRRDVGRSAGGDLALLGGLDILDEVLRRSDAALAAVLSRAAGDDLLQGDGELVRVELVS
jgi:hypothetical protein